VGIAGLGTVGVEVVRLIERQARVLSERTGRGIRVVAVTARSKAKKRGIDLSGINWARDPQALASDPEIDCLVELMGGVGDPALSAIDTALKSVSSARANLGAVQNRFEHTITNLNVAVENLSASESQIRDTDMAQEMTKFTRSQILQQAGTSMLAQANQSQQSVLKLLG